MGKPFRNPSGSWTQMIDLPPDPATGKRRQRRVTAATKKDLAVKAAAVITQAQTGFADPQIVTVREYFDQWIEDKAPTLRASTVRRYRDLARLHIVGEFGGLKVQRIAASDVQRLYTAKLAEGLSPTTVRHLHSVLHIALDDGVRRGMLLRNVSDQVDPPKRNRSEMKCWTLPQAQAFLAVAEGDDWAALWELALTTGMRRGELLGLKWSDLDLDAGAVSVQRTLSRGGTSRLVESPPKTKSGRRRIALPAYTTEMLKRHRVRQVEHRLAAGVAYEDRGLIFTNTFGAPLHPNSLALRFKKLVQQARVPIIRIHDLRHTSATMLLAMGTHPKIVQERLGHADISETMRYSHVLPTMQQEAADALGAALGRAS